jgi:hypothetical protein
MRSLQMYQFLLVGKRVRHEKDELQRDQHEQEPRGLPTTTSPLPSCVFWEL